ncbi:30S ribosomal protein S8e [Candidatus Woesearchaeota archaeon]|nr:30S ribosomal protein S8e [Candidatus Woesearchaeota archaeon]
MVLVQSRSKRQASGARYTNTNTKRKHQIGREPALTKLDDKDKRKTVRTKGGGVKAKLLNSDKVNIMDPKTKKNEIVEIDAVVENPANRHFVRRNIITKGTIIETKKGKARITNRPGQEGMLNAVLTGE